jgi:hypothetical protein
VELLLGCVELLLASHLPLPSKEGNAAPLCNGGKLAGFALRFAAPVRIKP